MKTAEKWLTMLLLCLSGSVIYWLPWLSDVFYVPMKNAFGFSHTEIGFLLSAFGLTGLVGYFPGGWLADRFQPRKLIAIALLITSAAGYVLATIPSFKVSVLLFVVFGLSSSLIFWSALIKAIRGWGSKREQGRAYGILEGGRNVTDSASATILLSIFALSGGDYEALSESILLQATVPLLLAIMVWFVMKDDMAIGDEPTQSKITVDGLRTVIRMPMVWLLAIIILTAYSGYWGSVYLTSYATDIYALGDVIGGAVSVGKYWIGIFAAIAAGFLADKIGAAKAVVGSFILMTTGFLIFGMIPGAPNLVPLLLLNAVAIAAGVFALRGIYFALLEQGGIPVAVTGTTAGIVSLVGFTPDIFVPPMAGIILDANPGAVGYQMFFLIIAGISFVGLVAAYLAYQKIQTGSLAWHTR